MARGDSTAQVLKNKRLVNRVRAVASTATLTPDLSVADHYHVTALAVNMTIAAPIGNPKDGDKLIIRVKGDGTSRTLTWNAIYQPVGLTNLPVTTGTGNNKFLEFRYNDAAVKWQAVINVSY